MHVTFDESNSSSTEKVPVDDDADEKLRKKIDSLKEKQDNSEEENQEEQQEEQAKQDKDKGNSQTLPNE